MDSRDPAAKVTDIEAAATGRWLAKALAPTRARVQEEPTAEAVDRIRKRVLGEPAPSGERTLAA